MSFWMELIIEGGLQPASKVNAQLNELVAIMASSGISAKRGSQSTTTNQKSAT